MIGGGWRGEPSRQQRHGDMARLQGSRHPGVVIIDVTAHERVAGGEV